MDDPNNTTDFADPVEDYLLFPPRRPDTHTRPRPVFLSLHAAYHRLSRRLQRLLDETGASLSPTEAAVLVAITRDPGAAIALSRRDAGLHPSTMTSVLDRLEQRGLIRREPGTEDHRFVAIWPTLQGRIASDQARAALVELDDELSVHVHREDLAALGELEDAAGAIGTRGTPPDY